MILLVSILSNSLYIILLLDQRFIFALNNLLLLFGISIILIILTHVPLAWKAAWAQTILQSFLLSLIH